MAGFMQPTRIDDAAKVLGGAIENGISLASEGVAALAGGLSYIPAAMAGGNAAGQHVKREVESKLTYSPRTVNGVAQIEARRGLMSPIADKVNAASENIGQSFAGSANDFGASDSIQATAFSVGKIAIPALLSAIPMMRGSRLVGGNEAIVFHAGRVESGAPFVKFSDSRLQQNGEANRYGPGLYTYIEKENAQGFADEVMAGTLKSQKAEGTGAQQAHIYRIKVDVNERNTLFSNKAYSDKEIKEISSRLEAVVPGISVHLRKGMIGDQIINVTTNFLRGQSGNKISLTKPKAGEIGPKTKTNAALLSSGFRYISGRIPRPDSNGAFDKGLIILSPESGGAKIINGITITGKQKASSVSAGVAATANSEDQSRWR